MAHTAFLANKEITIAAKQQDSKEVIEMRNGYDNTVTEVKKTAKDAELSSPAQKL